MRLRPALAFAAILIPFITVAQTDEWVRDDMSDESLWLLRTGNLAREPSTAGVFPGAPERGSQWVVSKGDGPAYVVYFLPGAIHEVEIDTHRLAGAAGDFTLAVSTDGKLYQPIDTGSVLLDSSFGWDYRLMASDQIPENATHLLVQFPNGSTAHRLSEVWIRYTWDDALVNRFLPVPAAPPPAESEFSLQSDADLQLLLDQLMALARKDPAPSVDPLDTSERAETAAFPEPQTSFAARPSLESVPALGQPELLSVDDEEEEEEEIAEPALVVGDTTLPETVDEKNSVEENTAPGGPAVADESTPTIVAQGLLGENEASEASPDAVIEVAIEDPAVASADDVAEDTDASAVATMTDEPQEPIEVAPGLPDAIDVAEFDNTTALESAVASIEPGESIDIEPLAIAAAEREQAVMNEAQDSTEPAPIFKEAELIATELVATPEPGPALSFQSVSEEPAHAAPDVTAIAVAEFEAPAESASALTVASISAPAEEPVLTFDHVDVAPTVADEPVPEPTLPEFAPTPTVVAGTEPAVVADAPAIAPTGEPSPIPDTQPDVATVELPVETAAHVEAVDLAVFADSEVEVGVVTTSADVIAISSTPDNAPEESERVWRLPPFDLPIMSASQARDDAVSIQEEPVSSRVELSSAAVREPAPADPVKPATQIIAAAPDTIDPTNTPPFDASSSGLEGATSEAAPAAQSDSGPMLIAAAEERAVHSPNSEISEDTEPDRRPTVKVRRVGPRSKSRDFYSARR
jgi:hypothetical protein